MHYYQFNIGDYASHTRHLSIYEDIAYRRLLDWYYLNEKPIPKSPQDAARLIGMKDRYPDVECVLEEFFSLSENGWINKRADEEISVYKGFVESGKRGAAKRWAKGAYSPPIATPIANNNHKPLTIKQEETKPTSAKSAISIKTFIKNCEDSGERRIPENDPVFEFAETTGISLDMVKVCWNHFVDTHMQNGKRQKDWRGTFRNCVKGNWYKLWFVEADGTVKETSQYRALKKGQPNV